FLQWIGKVRGHCTGPGTGPARMAHAMSLIAAVARDVAIGASCASVLPDAMAIHQPAAEPATDDQGNEPAAIERQREWVGRKRLQLVEPQQQARREQAEGGQ